MKLGTVIGTVTLSKVHPTLVGARWVLTVPLHAHELATPAAATSEEFVTYDHLGAGAGQVIAIAEGAEAARPFHPDQVPIDAYCAALIDHLDVTPFVADGE